MWWAGFGMTTAFVPMWDDASSAPKWAFAALMLPALLPPGKAPGWPLLVALALVAWAAASLLWSPVPIAGVLPLCQMVIVGEAFVLGALRPLDEMWSGAGWGLALGAIVALQQVTGAKALLPEAMPPGGLFVNRDVMGETAALVALGLGFRPLSAGALLALVLSRSREAELAFGLGLTVMLWDWPRVRWVLLLAAGFVLVGGVLLGPSWSIQQRFEIWHGTASALTVFGAGIGQFAVLFPLHHAGVDVVSTTIEHAHDEPLELWFELGVGSLGVWALGVWALARSSSPVLLALGVECLLGFPLHLPATAILGAACAGRALARRGSVCGAFDDWGGAE